MSIITTQYDVALWLYLFTTVSVLLRYANEVCELETNDWSEILMTRMAYFHNANSQKGVVTKIGIPTVQLEQWSMSEKLTQIYNY